MIFSSGRSVTTEEAGGFPFGGKRFPIKRANKHILYFGGTGSGKTTSLHLFEQRALPEIGRHAIDGGWRALVSDPKNELLPALAGMGLTCPIVVANPFDRRSAACDLAADVTSPVAAQQCGRIIAPEEPNSVQPFWRDAVYHMCTGSMIAFN